MRTTGDRAAIIVFFSPQNASFFSIIFLKGFQLKFTSDKATLNEIPTKEDAFFGEILSTYLGCSFHLALMGLGNLGQVINTSCSACQIPTEQKKEKNLRKFSSLNKTSRWGKKIFKQNQIFRRQRAYARIFPLLLEISRRVSRFHCDGKSVETKWRISCLTKLLSIKDIKMLRFTRSSTFQAGLGNDNLRIAREKGHERREFNVILMQFWICWMEMKSNQVGEFSGDCRKV